MRAPTVMSFGGPEVFRIIEQPDLTPGRGEVVVNVEVADVLWLETAVRSGMGQDYWPMRPPYIPGDGVAGRVSDVGTDVDEAWVGRPVVAHTGNEGGYADQAVVAVTALSRIPEQLDMATAAALVHDAPTALALFEATGVGPASAVLVIGASGGLGLLCVQLGLARAARVVAIARGPKLDRIGSLGPVVLVGSEQPDWVEKARAALPEAGADVVLDNLGGDLGEAAFELVAPGGRFSGHGTPSGRFAEINEAMARERRVTVTGIEKVQLSDADLRTYTELALTEAAAGRLAPVIGQTFTLDQVGEAHAAIEGRQVFGKTLLKTR